MIINPAYCGILPVNKPVGLTSTCVVNRLATALRRAKTRVRAGHAGTLDKTASGLLLVLIGKATRWFDELQTLPKVYLADIRLDAFSTTDDSDGLIEPVAVGDPPARADLERALAGFVGAIMQQPPSYSRVHTRPGKRSDKLSRKASRTGQPLTRPQARAVNVYGIDVLGYAWPTVQVRVTCGRGMYIRSLARDLGGRLGTGGYLSALVREKIGPLGLSEAVPIPSDRPIYPAEAVGWLGRLREKPPMNADERG